MTDRRSRRRRRLILGGVLLLEMFALAAIHLCVLRPIEQQRIEERRASLLRLDDPRVIIVPPPRDPIRLLTQPA